MQVKQRRKRKSTNRASVREYRSRYVISVGTLEDEQLADNFISWLWSNGHEFRIPYEDEELYEYVDYLFQVLEDLTPENKYFGTPDDVRKSVFGFWPLPDKRSNN